jgi:ABC-type antimicrobial peptide transport system permease subunit
VGVAEDVRSGLVWRPELAFVYVPARADERRVLHGIVRLRDPRVTSRELADVLRREAAQVHPDLRVVVRALEEPVAYQVAPFRVLAGISTGVGAIALVMAMSGLYGVMSLAVAQRTREIGIRLALGARRHTVMREVLARAARLAATGLVLGALGAGAATRVLRRALIDVAPLDPVAFGGVLSVLALTALGAAFLPALRAAAVDPLVALRAD